MAGALVGLFCLISSGGAMLVVVLAHFRRAAPAVHAANDPTARPHAAAPDLTAAPPRSEKAPAAVAASPAPAPDKSAVLAGIKRTTVFIKVEGADGGATGSGFLLHVGGRTGLIATNFHVIDMPQKEPPRITVVFDSSLSSERSIPAALVAADPERDLAILRVESPGLPAPVPLTSAVVAVETMPVFVCGFPFGTSMSVGKDRNPSITIGRASVSSLRRDESGRIAIVQIDGALNPGNSGGPIVDEQGRLVGIAVAKLRDSGIGFAIPHEALRDLLDGRALHPAILPVRSEGDTVEVIAVVPIADPFEKVQSVVLHQAAADSASDQLRATTDGNWPLLPKSERINLTIKRPYAGARIRLKRSGAATRLFQVAYTNRDGKTVVTKPMLYSMAVSSRGETPVVTETSPPPRARGTTLSMVSKLPERYSGQTISVPAQLFGIVVKEADGPRLQVFDENNARPANLRFTATAEVLDGLRKMALAAETYPVRVTVKVGAVGKDGSVSLEITQLSFLDASGKEIGQVPGHGGAPGTDLSGPVTMSILNRAPEKHIGKTVVIDAMLYGVAGSRGNVYFFQITSSSKVRPNNLDFITSRDLCTQWADLGYGSEFIPVKLTCTIRADKHGNRQHVWVSRVDVLDESGGISRTLADGQ